MKRIKIVFIIPGFRHKISQKGYKELSVRLKKEGFIVVKIPICWRNSTILDNVSCFLDQYKKTIEKHSVTSRDIYIVGFSYGALVAFLAATKIRVQGLILCSLSPFFKEDLPKKLPENASSLEEKRHEVFSSLRLKVIARKIKTRSLMMLYGEKESKKLIKRTKSAFQAVISQNKYLFSIKDTDHEIANKKYISAIHFATSFL